MGLLEKEAEVIEETEETQTQEEKAGADVPLAVPPIVPPVVPPVVPCTSKHLAPDPPEKTGIDTSHRLSEFEEQIEEHIEEQAQNESEIAIENESKFESEFLREKANEKKREKVREEAIEKLHKERERKANEERERKVSEDAEAVLCAILDDDLPPTTRAVKTYFEWGTRRALEALRKLREDGELP